MGRAILVLSRLSDMMLTLATAISFDSLYSCRRCATGCCVAKHLGNDERRLLDDCRNTDNASCKVNRMHFMTASPVLGRSR